MTGIFGYLNNRDVQLIISKFHAGFIALNSIEKTGLFLSSRHSKLNKYGGITMEPIQLFLKM
jgi:hypothetical protein